jgi:ParB/RepB/Spo0J family partition protein
MAEPRNSKQIVDLPLSDVFPNPDQPRKHFDQVKLEELAANIKEHEVQQPIKVTPRDNGYMIIMGERRYRASILAGKETIPSIIEEHTPQEIKKLALIENMLRQDMNPIEEARGLQDLLDSGMTKEEVAKTMSFKQVWRVDERTSLLKLTEENQALVIQGKLGNSQAFEMSRVTGEKQAIVLRKILAGELGSYNKLRAFVDGMIAIEDQTALFTLMQATAEERESLADFETMVKTVEKLIGAVYEGERRKHLEKAAFHTNITPDRLDLIIQGLQRIRKTVLEGAGVKEAIAA